MKVVIIGNGPASVKAREAIAFYNKTLGVKDPEITVISSEKSRAYSPMFIVECLTGKLNKEDIYLEDKSGLSFVERLGGEVVEVYAHKHQIGLKNGDLLNYDKLLIASGASPIKPPITGIGKKGVFFLNRLEDVNRLSKHLPTAQNIIVIGAGAIGIEASIAFLKMKKNVIVFELCDRILPQFLDKKLSLYLETYLQKMGAKFLLGHGVSEITGNVQATGVIVENRYIAGDLILVTTGIKPNIEFLKSSGLKVKKGVLVNEKMETNIRDIYAAGDVAESICSSGETELILDWYSACDQGSVAGGNIIGRNDVCQSHPGPKLLKGIDIPVVSVGWLYSGKEEVLSYQNEKHGIYEKIFIRDNYIYGYQAIGLTDKLGLMFHYIKDRKDISVIKDMLLFNRFNRAKLAY